MKHRPGRIVVVPREEVASEPPPAPVADEATRKRSGVRRAVGWSVEQPFAREGAAPFAPPSPPSPPSPPPPADEIDFAVVLPTPPAPANPSGMFAAVPGPPRVPTPQPFARVAGPTRAPSASRMAAVLPPPPPAAPTASPSPPNPGEGRIAVRRATPVGGILVLNDFTKRTVSYMSPARIVAGENNIDGRCDGVGVEGVLLMVPEGLVRQDNVVVRFSLPVSGGMVSIPCAVVWRAPGRAGHELLGCQFSVVRQEVQQEIFDYVAALRSKSMPPSS